MGVGKRNSTPPEMRLSWTSFFLCFILSSIYAFPSYFDYPYLLHQTEDEVEPQPDKRIMVPMRSSLKDLTFGKLLQGMNPTIVGISGKIQELDNPIRKRLMLPLSNKNIPLPGFGAMRLNINYD